MTAECEHSVCCFCGGCVGVCPTQALTLEGRILKVDEGKCTSCGTCVKFCPVEALRLEDSK